VQLSAVVDGAAHRVEAAEALEKIKGVAPSYIAGALNADVVAEASLISVVNFVDNEAGIKVQAAVIAFAAP